MERVLPPKTYTLLKAWSDKSSLIELYQDTNQALAVYYTELYQGGFTDNMVEIIYTFDKTDAENAWVNEVEESKRYCPTTGINHRPPMELTTCH